MNEFVKKRMERFQELKAARADLDATAREVVRFYAPDLGRLDKTAALRDKMDTHLQRWDWINDPTPAEAHTITTNGLTSGFTPSSRPWFRLAFEDQEMNDWGPARKALDMIQDRARRVLRASNFYSMMWLSNAEESAFGNSAILYEADQAAGMRFKTLTWGEWWIDRDAWGNVDTLFRVIGMSARQMAQRFGPDKLSVTVKNAFEKAPNTTFEIIHAVQPREDRDPKKLDGRNKAWESIYFDPAADGKPAEAGLLRESGMDSFPFICSGWPRIGSDIYGIGSPGMRSVPISRELQKATEDYQIAAQKQGNPPVVGPTGLMSTGINDYPGGKTYLDMLDGSKPAFGALYQVNINLEHCQRRIDALQRNIMKAGFADLFLMISALDDQRGDITAYQIMQMQAEKLQQLGGFAHIQQDEKYDVVVQETVELILSDPQRFRIGPLPPELTGSNYVIEYENIFAQAERADSVQAIDETLMGAGNLKQVIDPMQDPLDNFIVDDLIRARAMIRGLPAQGVRSKDEVIEIRKARQQQAQQLQQAAELQAGVQGMKDLGTIKTGEDDPNMASDIAGMLMEGNA